MTFDPALAERLGDFTEAPRWPLRLVASYVRLKWPDLTLSGHLESLRTACMRQRMGTTLATLLERLAWSHAVEHRAFSRNGSSGRPNRNAGSDKLAEMGGLSPRLWHDTHEPRRGPCSCEQRPLGSGNAPRWILTVRRRAHEEESPGIGYYSQNVDPGRPSVLQRQGAGSSTYIHRGSSYSTRTTTLPVERPL